MTRSGVQPETGSNGGAGNGATAPVVDRRRLVLLSAGRDGRGWLAGISIRKKLIVVHTVFSLTLATILLVAIRPATDELLNQAEGEQSAALISAIVPYLDVRSAGQLGGQESDLGQGLRARLPSALADLVVNAQVRSGTAGNLGLPTDVVGAAVGSPGRPFVTQSSVLGVGGVVYLVADDGPTFVVLSVKSVSARRAVMRLYVFVVGALLGVYALIAIGLEVLVLPKSVYEPIGRMLAADRAVQAGDAAREVIPPEHIPSDELGEIMTSRNESVMKLRSQGAALTSALGQLEEVANDLKKKNHLLEAARRNLADADRLAALGMMSAGIAHELNTPLAVVKGLTEKLSGDPERRLTESEVALMLRVVGRLERLGESLLDYARVRPPRTRQTVLRSVVQEAMTLVGLDRDASRVELENGVDEKLELMCDGDRMVQVFVNLIRNGVDAVVGGGGGGGSVRVEASRLSRDGREWVSIVVRDTGPGIAPAILPRLFEPFATTRLDSKGTGLGLAVAEGIVTEHGGVLLARSRADKRGAEFEVVLPVGVLTGELFGGIDGSGDGLMRGGNA